MRLVSFLARRRYVRSLSAAGASLATALMLIGLRWDTGFYALPTVAMYICAGGFRIVWDEPWSMNPAKVGWVKPNVHTLPFRWGFGGERTFFSTAGITRTCVDVPLWAVAASLGGVCWLQVHCARRRPAGSCGTCGYDLTGTATDVCPECGTVRSSA